MKVIVADCKTEDCMKKSRYGTWERMFHTGFWYYTGKKYLLVKYREMLEWIHFVSTQKVIEADVA
ncbi:hypothetical protein ACE418_04610 [Megasphaera sp. WILCCON 0056]|uniref:hypothetical protein n=1 Tax=Megasphaera sp. WILCCON 0056 TaxID=3345340 RepID=UPI003A7F6E68